MAAPSSDAPSPPWADLPVEMVDAVAEHLDVLSAARLAAVCSSWAASVATNPALPLGTPCLLMASEEPAYEEEDEFELLDLTRGGGLGGWERPDPPPPAHMWGVARGHEWVGGKDDWLATVDKRGHARLVNPYTGRRVDLPDISSAVVSGGGKTRAAFVRIVGYLVVAVVGEAGVLAIARGAGDDGGWTALKSPAASGNHFYCSDAVVHKGKVVAVDRYGDVHAWNIERAAASDAEPEVLTPPPPPHGDGLDGFKCRWRLAESADGCRLLLVRIYGKDTDPDPASYGHRMYLYSDAYHAEGVRVYERDVDDAAAGDGGWSPVVSLGDHSLFLGVNFPFMAHVVNRYSPGAYWVQLRPNCVCVTYNHASIGSELFDCDMQIFSLGDKGCSYRSSRLFPTDRCSYQTPMWFRPVLKNYD